MPIQFSGSLAITGSIVIQNNGEDIIIGSTGSTNLSASYADYSVTSSYALNGGANTGDITFEGIKIIGAGTGSGDGNNYSTIELVPDNDLYNNDQYLIIDPTAPNHVHIRPGGDIDNSAADLIIGGEDNHLIVSDNNNEVKINRQSVSFINNYTFTPGLGYSTAEWSSDGSTHTITLNDPTGDAYNATWNINTPPGIFSVIDSDSNYHELLVLGSSTPGGPSPITIIVNQAPPTNPISLNQVYFEINQYTDAYVRVTNDITIEAADDIRMYSRDVFSLRNYSTDEAIDIVTQYDSGNEYNWSFSSNGNTIFPYLTTPRGDISGGDLNTNTLKLGDGSNEAVISTPNGNEFYLNSQRLVINPGQGSGSGEGGDIYLWAGRGGVDGGSGGDVKVRGGYGPVTGGGGYVRIEGGDTDDGSAGFVEIKGGNSNTAAGGTVNIYGGFGNGNTQNGNVTIATYDTVGTQKTWTFNTDGTLNVPGNIEGTASYATTSSYVASADYAGNSDQVFLTTSGLNAVPSGDYPIVFGWYAANDSYNGVYGKNTNLSFNPTNNNVKVSGSLLVTGSISTNLSLILSNTQSAAPSWTGVDGEVVSATVGGQYYLYMWMAGSWRSTLFT